MHFLTDTLWNSSILATVAAPDGGSQVDHFLVSPLWYVFFLPTTSPWIQQGFFKHNKCPAGICQVKVNLLLMKQEAHSFSTDAIHQKKATCAHKCHHPSHQSHLSCRVFQREITIRPVRTCYLQAAELIYALLMSCHTGQVSCRQIKRQRHTFVIAHSSRNHIHFALIATFLGRRSPLMASTSKAGASTASDDADKVVGGNTWLSSIDHLFCSSQTLNISSNYPTMQKAKNIKRRINNISLVVIVLL